MLKIKPERSINGHNVLHACVVISRDSFEKTIIFTEETDGVSVITYVLSKEQANKLEKLGINIRKTDSHHFAQKVLRNHLFLILREKLSIRKSKASKCGIEFKSDNDLVRILKAIEKEIAFNLIIILPYDIHQIYNHIFRECLAPKEVLLKLNLILEGWELSGSFRDYVIDLFSFIAVLVKNISDIDVKKINNIKSGNNTIATAKLLDLLGITKEDIQECISNLFLYPEHQDKTKHFDILTCLYRSYKNKE